VAAAAVVLLAFWLGGRQEGRERDAALAAAEAEARARVALEDEVRSLRREVEAEREVLALLDAPGSRVVELAPLPGKAGRATAVVNLDSRRAVVVSSSLVPEPGRVYQLWVIRGSAAPFPAGFLRETAAGVSLGVVDPALLASRPDAFAVSLEPQGGSPAPTDVRLVGKLAG
jgi:hypothetical protein